MIKITIEDSENSFAPYIWTVKEPKTLTINLERELGPEIITDLRKHVDLERILPPIKTYLRIECIVNEDSINFEEKEETNDEWCEICGRIIEWDGHSEVAHLRHALSEAKAEIETLPGCMCQMNHEQIWYEGEDSEDSEGYALPCPMCELRTENARLREDIKKKYPTISKSEGYK